MDITQVSIRMERNMVMEILSLLMVQITTVNSKMDKCAEMESLRMLIKLITKVNLEVTSYGMEKEQSNLLMNLSTKENSEMDK